MGATPLATKSPLALNEVFHQGAALTCTLLVAQMSLIIGIDLSISNLFQQVMTLTTFMVLASGLVKALISLFRLQHLLKHLQPFC